MFKRIISVMLIAALATSQCAFAVTAGDALFGNASVQSTPEPAYVEEYADEAEFIDDNGASASNYIELKLGDKDVAGDVAYIVYLQNRLIELGYLSGSPDGAYGPGTEAAVKNFQKNNGLHDSGIADVNTQRKLFSDISTLATPSPDEMSYGGNEDIKNVQRQLITWGFLTGSADGVMGKSTKTAIKDFQKYMLSYDPGYGVAPTPTPTPQPVGDEMPIVMDMLLTTPVPESEIVSGEINYYLMEYISGKREFPVYRKTVQDGDENSDALRVQKRLRQLKYLYTADGQFGANSVRALCYFQRKHGLEETGIADKATQTVLFSSQASKAEEYVFPYRIGVDISQQKVYIMGWTGQDYSELVGTMICSTGLDATPTPTGTYQSLGRTGGEDNGMWYYFEKFNCYAKWAYRIVGDIMFHSVVYSSEKRLRQSTVNNLGKKASHGCIRLSVENAKWIYDNCPVGTTVEIRK